VGALTLGQSGVIIMAGGHPAVGVGPRIDASTLRHGGDLGSCRVILIWADVGKAEDMAHLVCGDTCDPFQVVSEFSEIEPEIVVRALALEARGSAQDAGREIAVLNQYPGQVRILGLSPNVDDLCPVLAANAFPVGYRLTNDVALLLREIVVPELVVDDWATVLEEVRATALGGAPITIESQP
jgi:hypothetical protein